MAVSGRLRRPRLPAVCYGWPIVGAAMVVQMVPVGLQSHTMALLNFAVFWLARCSFCSLDHPPAHRTRGAEAYSLIPSHLSGLCPGRPGGARPWPRRDDAGSTTARTSCARAQGAQGP